MAKRVAVDARWVAKFVVAVVIALAAAWQVGGFSGHAKYRRFKVVYVQENRTNPAPRVRILIDANEHELVTGEPGGMTERIWLKPGPHQIQLFYTIDTDEGQREVTVNRNIVVAPTDHIIIIRIQRATGTEDQDE